METENKPPFDMLEAYAFMLWMWRTYPHELIEFAQEYHDEKQLTAADSSISSSGAKE